MNASKAAKIKELLAAVEAKDKEQPQQVNELRTSDIRWSSFSEESQEVLLYFGINAPHTLNEYCCAVEDSLITAVEKLHTANDLVQLVMIQRCLMHGCMES